MTKGRSPGPSFRADRRRAQSVIFSGALVVLEKLVKALGCDPGHLIVKED